MINLPRVQIASFDIIVFAMIYVHQDSMSVLPRMVATPLTVLQQLYSHSGKVFHSLMIVKFLDELLFILWSRNTFF